MLDLDKITPAPSEPNTGRMVDFWLGGSIHFPMDVEAARALEVHMPFAPQLFAVLRRYIGRVARFIQRQGIEQILVLGAGIPTRNNVHEVAPGARVLYTDIDPVNIAIGRTLVEGRPNVGYAYADVRDPSTLDPAEMAATLGPVRRLGIIAVGVSMFLADDELARALADLHAWAPEGSILAFDLDGEEESRAYPEVLELMGDGFYPRTPAGFAPLLGPWRLSREGIVPVNQWGDAGDDVDQPCFMYGGVAYK